MMSNYKHSIYWLLIVFASLIVSCKQTDTKPQLIAELDTEDVLKNEKLSTKIDNDFKAYWYAGEAEISSYQLEQARYGELRDGKAVLVFVTEDFLPDAQVKADGYSNSNIPILKLNATKKFNTGIYPYSIMESTFFPVANNQHPLKISASVQEWCGHVYTQLNNRSNFEITSHSYFQSEADASFQLEKTWTENSLWTKLRIDPKSLPTGNLQLIPSLEYTRLKHKTIKAYNAMATLKAGNYTIVYSGLNRTLSIDFNPNFPYDILGWEETTPIYGSSKTITTKAKKLKTIKSAYWGKNGNQHSALREHLKLD